MASSAAASAKRRSRAPAILPELPLTITTAPPVERRERPYDDGFSDGGFIVEDHPETLSFGVAIDDQVGAQAVWQFNDPAALTGGGTT